MAVSDTVKHLGAIFSDGELKRGIRDATKYAMHLVQEEDTNTKEKERIPLMDPMLEALSATTTLLEKLTKREIALDVARKDLIERMLICHINDTQVHHEVENDAIKAENLLKAELTFVSEMICLS
ncbi:unnamed protein product [Caenorhabditis angaria]|uniref:Uncharacterized protein n=1 Tax=Caenorhabditis angaria TaxID=860376 RepID=A0A9P1IQS0_9PELO|nr:unnamed protein product [Caenorhabditis angaria]